MFSSPHSLLPLFSLDQSPTNKYLSSGRLYRIHTKIIGHTVFNREQGVNNFSLYLIFFVTIWSFIFLMSHPITSHTIALFNLVIGSETSLCYDLVCPSVGLLACHDFLQGLISGDLLRSKSEVTTARPLRRPSFLNQMIQHRNKNVSKGCSL